MFKNGARFALLRVLVFFYLDKTFLSVTDKRKAFDKKMNTTLGNPGITSTTNCCFYPQFFAWLLSVL